MKTWVKGWRVIVTCDECGFSFWCRNIGETSQCNCKKPKTLYQDAQRYHLGGNEYKITYKQIERAY